MMNLLTGLAVDDISMIRSKAEIVGLKTKIEIIWKAEKQLLQCRNDSSIANFLNGTQFSFCPNDPHDPIHPIHPPDVFPRCLEVFKVILFSLGTIVKNYYNDQNRIISNYNNLYVFRKKNLSNRQKRLF